MDQVTRLLVPWTGCRARFFPSCTVRLSIHHPADPVLHIVSLLLPIHIEWVQPFQCVVPFLPEWTQHFPGQVMLRFDWLLARQPEGEVRASYERDEQPWSHPQAGGSGSHLQASVWWEGEESGTSRFSRASSYNRAQPVSREL